MKAVVSSKRPCVLIRGEMRRVPQDRSYKGIVGYHVCCPRCGFVTAVLNGVHGLMITEPSETAVSFSQSFRCVYCNATIFVADGEITFEEDEHVRSVCYRRS
jgi:hypothetical protein